MCFRQHPSRCCGSSKPKDLSPQMDTDEHRSNKERSDEFYRRFARMNPVTLLREPAPSAGNVFYLCSSVSICGDNSWCFFSWRFCVLAFRSQSNLRNSAGDIVICVHLCPSVATILGVSSLGVFASWRSVHNPICKNLRAMSFICFHLCPSVAAILRALRDSVVSYAKCQPYPQS